MYDSVVFIALTPKYDGNPDRTNRTRKLILSVAAICAAVATRHGFGYHIWTIHPPTRAIAAARIVFIGGAFVFFGIALAKTSICLTLYNISTKKWQRWTLVFMAVSVLMTKLLSGIFIFVSCSPVEKRWNPMVKGKCWDINVLCRYWSFSGGEFPAWSSFSPCDRWRGE